MLKKLMTGVFLIMSFYWPQVVFAKKVKNEIPPVFVETVTVKFTPRSDQISSTGSLIAIPGVIVKPETSGRITKIYFKSGDVVAKDTDLIEINPDIIKADLVEAESELTVKKLNFERYSALYKTRDVSKSDFDKAQAEYNSAKAKIEGIQAKLHQTVIKAPFAGKLGLSQVNIGDYINVGQNIVNLQTVNPLKVDFNIPEAYQSRVAVDQVVLLHTDAYPQETFSGKVEVFESLINQSNRTLNVRANVPNENGKLIPGGFVEVTLQFAEQQVITIPQTSIMYTQDGSYVFKVVGGKAEKIKVALGTKDSDNVVIKDGLKPGDVVVTAGQIKLHPGAQVVVKN